MPILQNTTGIIKTLINFQFSDGGYATEFSKYKKIFIVRYEHICTILYTYLEVNELQAMKVNESNYL